MVEVLLLAPFDEESLIGTVVKGSPFRGLCVLAAILEAHGFSVALAEGVKPSAVKSLLAEHKPRLVGVSVSSPLSHQARKLIAKVRESGHACTVIAGGPHVTAQPDASKLLGADFGLAGECEKTFPLLVRSIIRGEGSLDDVPGLIKGEKVYGSVPHLETLDSQMLPAFGLLDLRAYGSLPLELSRGCPFDCVYCTRCVSGGVRFRSPEDVACEMEHHVAAYGAGNFSFVDDVFTLERERVLAFCGEISRRRLRVSWSATTRADCVDEELLRAMKEAGCGYVSFGLESGVERIRFKAGKEVSNKAYERAFSLCRKLKLPSAAHVLFGLPGEGLSEMRESVSFVKDLAPTYAVFRNTVVLPGSRLFECAVRDGIVSEDCWRVFAERGGRPPTYVPEGVSYARMEELRRKAISSFYFDRRYLARRLLASNGVGELLGFPYFMYLVGRFSPDFP